ncbi:glucosyl-3-phosphoglycerate synthase [Enterococcus hirae]|uniref:glucosyl-3-phosphoglycerate synthase n=1 Tax=Enterococcus hirae TaxID=1354 RepID=UPI0030EBB1CF
MSEWYARRTSRAADWPLVVQEAHKADTRVSVVLPPLNEEATVGSVVAMVVELAERTGLVDEVVVMDSGSTDATAEVAERAGATVHHRDDVLPWVGSRPGKGEVLWKSLAVTTGDVVVFVDSDLVDPHPALVTGLLGPLLCQPAVQLVKGCYDRPLAGAGSTSGGRVTELVARPLISRLMPDLSGVIQPLSGEYAARRCLLERLPFVSGYGVEIGLLVDAVRLVGLDGLAQVDLGHRTHRNQDTAALGRMAAPVLATVLSRASPLHDPDALLGELTQFARAADGRWVPEKRDVSLHERPPMATMAGYRSQGAAVAV